ncbi:hypothetical protein NBH15_02220 [Parabacteroides sp. W1-Q-101]|uniref:hypothetical protein n=1 Tax=Parabacteroides TaxID=375288 RepID=UPI00202E10AC|nr:MULTISPECIES: hypothetical protein [Parabacteroides]MCM0717087.1 hypothetical protein [Parabacteroides sp. W1-Q-101]
MALSLARSFIIEYILGSFLWCAELVRLGVEGILWHTFFNAKKGSEKSKAKDPVQILNIELKKYFLLLQQYLPVLI